jgi:hypothetical protein
MFREMVRFLIDEAKLTEAQIASAIGLSQPSVHRIGRGTQRRIGYEPGDRLRALYESHRSSRRAGTPLNGRTSHGA